MRRLILGIVSVLIVGCGTSNTVQRVTPASGGTGASAGDAATGGGGRGGSSAPASGGTVPVSAGAGGMAGVAGTHATRAGAAGKEGGAPGAGGGTTGGAPLAGTAGVSAGAAGRAPTVGGAAGQAATGGGGGRFPVGGAGALACSSVDDCPPPASECQVARCAGGECSVADRAANTPCWAGVCTGTGICGECLPGSGQCDANTPRVCGDDGRWETLAACPTLTTCNGGRCLQPAVDWIWHGAGVGSQSAVDLAPTSNGALLVASNFAAETTFGDLYAGAPMGAAGVLRLARATGIADAFFPLVPESGSARIGALAAAPDGTFTFGAAVSGLLGGVDRGNGWGLTQRVRSDLAGTHSTTRFWPEDSGTLFSGVEGVVVRNSESYVLASFERGIGWATSSPPYQDVELVTGCQMFLARLDYTGEPTWTASHSWCTGIDSKVLRQGPAGDLFVGGPGGSPNHGSAPVILGTTTIVNDASAVVAKFDPASGNVARVRELSCQYGASYRSGRVHDLAPLADGGVLAAVSCESTFVPDGLTLPDARGFLVRLDSNLEVLAARPLGAALDDATWFDRLRLAVGADETIYVTGTLAAGRYDFGTGPHEYQGTCQRCGPGDAFVASYTSDLEPRWSLPVASPGQDQGTAIARDADRIYVSAQLGGPATVLGHELVVEGTHDAVVFGFTE